MKAVIRERRATRANPERGTNLSKHREPPDNTTEEAALGYAAGYIASRFGVSLPLAALLARLAELGGALA